jgi:predicted N-formylglutamate amidohydrolase
MTREGAARYIRIMAEQVSRPPRIEGREEASYCVLPGRADRGLILICDHAANALPAEYETLGLAAAQLERHIAYDIGVAPIVRAMSARLGAPAVMTRYSRLLIDPNRGRDDPTLIMRLSDGAVVPGNREIDAAERAKRLNLYYDPYHRALDAVIDQCLATGVAPALVSIHSFTESWKQYSRPWHVGVLWGRDGRLARPLVDAFYAEGDLIVGENEPYAGQIEGDCLWQHGAQRGLANAIIELRQDLIRTPAGQAAWSERLCRIFGKVLPKTDQARQAGAREDRTGNVLGADRTSKQGEAKMTKLDKTLVTELEAAAFRRLVEHLRTRADVQNIDLMNLAGFCRNCLSNWYQEAALARGLDLTKEGAREVIYGMPYKEWQAKHQKEASADAKAAFEQAKPHQH